MQIKNKIFPYPVLNHNKGLSNYGDKDFLLDFEQEEDDTKFVLKNACFKTNSAFINDLYQQKKIAVYCILECSHTVVRKKFILDDKGKDIILYKADFSERVDISMFAVALDNFIYSSDEFESDYADISIEIEKNDIVAANDGFNLYFNHEEDEETFAQSIFSVVNDHNLEGNTYLVEFNVNRKILITLSDEEYKNYRTVYTIPVYQKVFFNMLLVPSLVEGLSLCQKMLIELPENDLDDVGNKYIWFRSIRAAYSKVYGQELDEEKFKSSSPITLAQGLLGKPFGEALDKLVKEISTGHEDGGEEDE